MVAWVLWSGEEQRRLTAVGPQRDGCGGKDVRGRDGGDDDNCVGVTRSVIESPYLM